MRIRLPKLEARNASLSFDEYLNYFSYGGLNYPFQTGGVQGQKQEDIDQSFRGFIHGAYKTNGIIFAVMLARQLPFQQARFQFQRREGGRLGELYGTNDLRILEKPWPRATTSNLLARMIQDADLAGNFLAYRKGADRLYRMPPDWVTIIVGSESDPDDAGNAIDAELVGYLYHPGGPAAKKTPIPLLPEQVAHFAPIPDPEFRFKGMSWLGPIVEEVMGDKAAMVHKRRFFEQGATPNVVVTGVPAPNEDAFKRWVASFQAEHGKGVLDAYKTLFLSGSADAKVIGSDLKQVDFKVTQGNGETRVCAAGRVPPIIVGLSEGLEAATYSNYGQARRAYADTTLHPLWGEAAGALAPVVKVPGGSELWYDVRGVPFLAEDQKDEAEIKQKDAATIKSLIDAGFTPESVVAAVNGGDYKWLKHTGLVSVQLFAPGQGPTPDSDPAPDNGTPPPDEANAAFMRLINTP